MTEKDLEGLPPSAMAALAARAAWRVLPLTYDLPPAEMWDVSAALAVADLSSLGSMPGGFSTRIFDAAQTVVNTASSYGDAVFSAVNAVTFACKAANTSFSSPADTAADALNALSHAAKAAEGVGETVAVLADLEFLRGWAGEKRAADGIVGPDFFQRPLWMRPDGETPPEEWLGVIDDWSNVADAAGLSWLVEQHGRLLKGSGLDLEGHQAFVEEWNSRYEARETRTAEEPREKADATEIEPESRTESDEPAKAPLDVESLEQPQLLAGGIVTAAADIPAIQDQLGRKPLVDTLADMLSSPKQSLPMTIALLGDWGSGKSSVIRQLKWRLRELAGEPQPVDEDEEGSNETTAEKIGWTERFGRCLRDVRYRQQLRREPEYADNCKYLCAEFNAWEYEQTDNIRAGLAQEVVRGLTSELSQCAKLRLAFTNAAVQHGFEFYSTIAGFFAIVVLGVLGVLAGDELSKLGAFNQSLLGAGGAAVLVYSLVKTWQKMMRFLEHPLADKLSTYLRLPDYGKHLGEIPVIKREIEGLCEARLASIPNGRLLVVVDDLDRCHPEKIIETLDAIRLVMNLKKVAVIVAIDDRIAFRSVAEHYKDLAQDGMRSKEEVARDYLGKIIQLPVSLYQPWPNEVGTFINEHLFQVSEESGEKDPGTESDTTGSLSKEQAPRRMSPAAAALIKEQRLDATAITGSGRGGSVLKRDVLDYQQARADRPKQGVAPDGDARAEEANAKVARSDMETQDDPHLEMNRAKNQEREQVMQDTAFERDLFAALAHDMDVHNPRQLIRLRNSYRLLKGYRHSRENRPLDTRWVGYLMHGLFWYEFLYQQKLADRRLAELVAWEWPGNDWEKLAAQRDVGETEKRKKLKEAGDNRADQLANPPVVNMSRRLNELLPGDTWADGYSGLMRTVEMAVLPNAQMGLLLTRHEADKVLASKSTAIGGAQLDPWDLPHDAMNTV